MDSISWSKNNKSFEDRNYEELYKEELYYASKQELYYARKLDFRISDVEPFKSTVVKYLIGNEKVFANHYDNIEKWKEKLSFAKENIFKYLSDRNKKVLKKYLILEKREKLFTVEFELKNKTTVKWGAYKTEEEAKIIYNKVDDYFKKTFGHFYKNLDNQEIYSL
jgi:hypothetical protein